MLVERTEDGGYGAWIPDLPGCVALGSTYDEVIAEMVEAVRLHLDGLRADGLPIPAPTTIASTAIDAA
ncbi:type II toxin-antitoxin system HicB family antitoxin [Amycolatopsis pigmentata]|uniref:Type II toxin-antitoxin system HicB family antitoxin n=1 Tax=Amycolatopsis pigmentata TaxID=450801 RepID=A0ABW5FUD9_9PSEU